MTWNYPSDDDEYKPWDHISTPAPPPAQQPGVQPSAPPPGPQPPRRWMSIALWLSLPVLLVAWFTVPRLLPHDDRSIKATIPAIPTLTTLPNGYLRVNPDHPFRDTPANQWREGSDGIEEPPAVPVGRFPIEQVAAAQDRAKQLIVLARLDQHTLDTGDAEPIIALVAPGQGAEIRSKSAPGNEAETWWVTTKLAPGFKLLPARPRVNGSMSATQDDKGELVIKTNYLVAYAFQAPDPKAISDPMEIIVLVREEIDYTWVDDSAYDAPSQGMWLDHASSFTYAGNCAWFKKGFLAPSYSDTPSYGTQVRPTEQYFDPTIPLPTENDC
ncbi:hypothetical protein [Nocardia sp. NPDC056000]|uniref:hypothetical protein n=1 Tax=Nocardia sp. NPDC056000 TaxID=3345674 RepID=UPI0035D6F8C1